MTPVEYYHREVARRIASGAARRVIGSRRFDVGMILIPPPAALAECVDAPIAAADEQWLRTELAALEASS